MKETVVQLIKEDLLGNKYPVNFRIVAYREFDGKLELEPITTKYVALGINWMAYPSSVIFIK